MQHTTPKLKTNMLFRKLYGDFRLNRAGFFAVWLVFVVGLVFYNSTYPAGSNLLGQIDQFYQETHLADLTFEFSQSPAAIVDTVKVIPGVQKADGRLTIEMGLTDRTALTTVRLISLPGSVSGIRIIDGRLPVTPDEMLLTAAFAAAQNIQVGDALQLIGSDGKAWAVTIVGTVISSEYLIGSRGPLQPFPTLSTFGVGYSTYDALAVRMNAAGKINGLVLTVEPGRDLNTIRAAASSILQPTLVLDRKQNASYATLNANASSNTQVGLIFSLIFLFGSGAIMAVLLARQVESERRQIGTLRALGFSRVEILVYYMAFAMLICITGTLVAVPLGYLITWPIMAFFENGLIGIIVPFFYNPPNVLFILFGVVSGLVMGVVAAALPAWKAATTDPGIALRPPSPARTGSLITIPALPLAGKQAIRNMLRSPGRTVSTVLGTACGLSLIVMAFAVWDSIDFNFARFYQSRQIDLVVTFSDVRVQDAALNQIRAVPGIIGVETGLIAPINVELASRTYTALGVVLDDNHQFTTVSGTPAFSNNKGVWLGHNLARVLNAGVGDMLMVSAQGSRQTVRVEGIVSQVVGSPMYVPMSLFSQWTPFGVRPINQAYVRVESPHKVDVQKALASLSGIIGIEDWRSTSQDIQHAADFNGNFAFIFLGFGLFLTFVVLFTTINANLHERRNELIVMRMQGLSMREIAGMVTWETIIASIAGLLIGALPTAWLVDYVQQLYNTDVAGMITTIYPLTWVAAIALLIGTALLSQGLPLRNLRYTNMGDVSKAVSV